MIRFFHFATFVVLATSCFAADWKTAEFIASADATRPILIPPGFFTSKYGKGKYRLDGPDSQGKVNCIFLFFEPKDPQLTVPTEWKQTEDSTLPKDTIINERIIENPFEGEAASGTAILRIRVTAKDADKSKDLIHIADSILKK